jgi:acyl dehydratase
VVGAYADLEVGQRVVSPPRQISDAQARVLIETMGYTHPLFADPDYARAHTPFPTTPLPGAVTLALMGGLAEQTDVFDDTVVALVGMDAVRFPSAAFPDDLLHLEMEVVAKEPSASGRRGVVTFAWRCVKQDGTVVAEANASLLFRLEG